MNRSIEKNLAALALAASLSGCITKPTPELIANCRDRASVTVREAPKARSLLVAASPFLPGAVSLRSLLTDWRLDFVELPARRQTGSWVPGDLPYRDGDPVDRVRLIAKGSPECVHWNKRDWTVPDADRLKAPAGQCIAVERGVASRAEMRVLAYRAADYGETFEALPAAGGEPVARVVDFSLRAGPEASRVDCDELRPGFPKDPAKFVIGRVAERR